MIESLVNYLVGYRVVGWPFSEGVAKIATNRTQAEETTVFSIISTPMPNGEADTSSKPCQSPDSAQYLCLRQEYQLVIPKQAEGRMKPVRRDNLVSLQFVC